MFGFGVPELVVIFVILLVIFGPGKLPQLGASLGGAIKSFKNASEEEARVINPGEDAEQGK